MRLRLDPAARARVNSLIMGALLIALFVLLAGLSTRYRIEADWTAAGRHSLSEASREVLNRLKGTLEITAYAREKPELRDAVRRFVDRYQRASPRVGLHFVNPDAAPDEVRNLGISVDGELVLRYEGRVEHVRTDSEEEFTNALQRLLRQGERWLAFVEGHGERSALGQAKYDLSEWARHLKMRGFRLQPLNLGETRAVPDNTSVLIIAGPRMEFLPGEAELALEYLERGGNLLWLTDPDAATPAALAHRLAVRFPKGVVIDFAGKLLGLNDPTVALVTASLYGPHPATDGFSLTTLYPGAGVIQAAEDSGWTVEKLLSTGEHTWFETGELQGEVSLDEGVDLPGPLTIGVSLSRDPDAGDGESRRTMPQRIV
ncbi:MAG: GldG family protein, partial [Burkholderiales bacterium]